MIPPSPNGAGEAIKLGRLPPASAGPSTPDESYWITGSGTISSADAPADTVRQAHIGKLRTLRVASSLRPLRPTPGKNEHTP
jgi:hypothetical protein